MNVPSAWRSRASSAFSSSANVVALLSRPIKTAQHAGDLLGISSGPENLLRVVLKRLDPTSDIRGMAARIMPNANFGARNERRDLSAKFLPRVARAPERVREVTVKTTRRTRPVPQFMQRRRIVSVRTGKLPALGQHDLIR